MIATKQMRLHDKLSLHHDLYGKDSKCQFPLYFLLKNGVSTKMSSSDFRAPMLFLLIDVKLCVSKKNTNDAIGFPRKNYIYLTI